MNFLKKHKGKIIFGVVAIIILVIAFMMGDKPATQKVSETILSPTPTAVAASEMPTEIPPMETETPTATPVPKSETITETATPTPSATTAPKKQESEKPATAPKNETTLVPTAQPKTDNKTTCTLSVRCDTILANKPKLKSEKVGLVPFDGVILPTTEVEFNKGESVFNILSREMRKRKIHLEFVNVPLYNSAYIEGIANLYEHDCGELSGWMYKVNGTFPNYGSSKYTIKDGDVIEWVYTCDWGNDVGGGYSSRNGYNE